MKIILNIDCFHFKILDETNVRCEFQDSKMIIAGFTLKFLFFFICLFVYLILALLDYWKKNYKIRCKNLRHCISLIVYFILSILYWLVIFILLLLLFYYYYYYFYNNCYHHHHQQHDYFALIWWFFIFSYCWILWPFWLWKLRGKCSFQFFNILVLDKLFMKIFLLTKDWWCN